MVWIIAVVITFWGLPLLTLLSVSLACVVSERLRTSVASFLGLATDQPSSPEARKTAVTGMLRHSGGDFQGGRT